MAESLGSEVQFLTQFVICLRHVMESSAQVAGACKPFGCSTVGGNTASFTNGLFCSVVRLYPETHPSIPQIPKHRLLRTIRALLKGP